MEIDEPISEYDSLDAAIEDYNRPVEPDFDYFDHYDDCYFEEIPMDAAYCAGELIGYVKDESNICDYDYPEGPDENLSGLRFGEPSYIEYDFDIPDFDFPDDFYDCPEMEYEITNHYGEYLLDNDEISMQKLIEELICRPFLYAF